MMTLVDYDYYKDDDGQDRSYEYGVSRCLLHVHRSAVAAYAAEESEDVMTAIATIIILVMIMMTLSMSHVVTDF